MRVRGSVKTYDTASGIGFRAVSFWEIIDGQRRRTRIEGCGSASVWFLPIVFVPRPGHMQTGGSGTRESRLEGRIERL